MIIDDQFPKTIDTGFSRHVDTLVDAEGDVSDPALEYAKRLFGDRAEEKWFAIDPAEYGKPWMYVIGVT